MTHEDLKLDAYYFGFSPTGVYEVDRILAAVASAGAGAHHTEDWNNEHDQHPEFGGRTAVESIQNAANDAAAAWNRRAGRWLT